MVDKVLAPQRTRQAIAAAEAGEIKDARELLSEALTLDHNYEPAWLWFAAITEDEAEKKYCLERAKSINPMGKASKALEELKGVKKKSPVELRKIIDPDPPEFEESYAAEARAKHRKKLAVRSLILALVIAIVAGIAFAIVSKPDSPVYIAVVAGEDREGAGFGQEITLPAQWAADTWNSANNDSEYELNIVTFYDNNDVERAKEIANQIVEDGKFAGVVGHELTRTSEAAGPIYAQAGIPVITPTATGDSLTADNPWYFRTLFDNTTEGNGIATYLSTVLKAKSAIVVNAQTPYGQSLSQGFINAFKPNGTVQAQIQLNEDPDKIEQGFDRAAAQINQIKDPGPIVISGLNPKLGSLATKLKGQAAESTIIGSEALSLKQFYDEIRPAGIAAVNRAMNATPVVRGTLGGPGTDFYNKYQQRYGYRPGWMAATTFDAIAAFGVTVTSTNFDGSEKALPSSRIKIRDKLASADSQQTAIPVLTGPLYFNKNRSAVRPVSFVSGRIENNGVFDIEPAPLQLANYTPTVGVPLNTALKNGTAVKFNNQVYTIQRIVMVGMNFNYIEDLDLTEQTFNTDFFLWFRFDGDKLPFEPEFINAFDPNQGIGTPQKVSQSHGQTYQLYRVNGVFKTDLTFNDFPFDKQRLPVALQAKNLPSSQLSFVVDSAVVSESQKDRLSSGIDPILSINRISNWKADAVNFFTTSIGNTANMGDPTALVGDSGVTYSEFFSDVDISRDIPSFLIKNLLPLMLLVAVSYLALWLPFKELSSRISFGVTGILTGAVMLGSVTSSLPQVDYTVAIEWAFYVFIGLSVCSVLVTLLGRRLIEERRLAGARHLEIASRIVYPLVILCTVLVYWMKFH